MNKTFPPKKMLPRCPVHRCINLRPHAHVVQVSDHTFAKAARSKIVDLVRAEVWRDRAAGACGVLAVASASGPFLTVAVRISGTRREQSESGVDSFRVMVVTNLPTIDITMT